MIDDARLDEVLAGIGPLLVVEAPESAPSRVPAAGPRPQRSTWRWIAVGAALAGIATTAVSPWRGAMADWLGIGSTHVEVQPDLDAVPADLPGIDAGATPISARDAHGELGPALIARLGTTALGAPTGFATIPEGGVLTVWPDGTTLWVHDGMLDAGGWLEKLVGTDEQVQPVDRLGDEALAVVGTHVLETPNRRIRADTTVLWTVGGTEYRLAGALPVELLVDAARVLDAV
jgi:hypothetical protein